MEWAREAKVLAFYRYKCRYLRIGLLLRVEGTLQQSTDRVISQFQRLLPNFAALWKAPLRVC